MKASVCAGGPHVHLCLHNPMVFILMLQKVEGRLRWECLLDQLSTPCSPPVHRASPTGAPTSSCTGLASPPQSIPWCLHARPPWLSLLLRSHSMLNTLLLLSWFWLPALPCLAPPFTPQCLAEQAAFILLCLHPPCVVCDLT